MHTMSSATFAIPVTHSLAPITAIYVICGWMIRNRPIIAVIVDFVELEDAKTFGIAMIVECALIHFCLMITIVKPAST